MSPDPTSPPRVQAACSARSCVQFAAHPMQTATRLRAPCRNLEVKTHFCTGCQREFQWPARKYAAALKQHMLACAPDAQTSAKLSLLRAWYGGPPNHRGEVRDIHAKQPWLWQEGNEKGKIVTDIVRRSLRSDGALDFNPKRTGCNGIFDFGHHWPCCKILAVEYRYGSGPVQTWFSPSQAFEPYACFLPASEDGAGGGGDSESKRYSTCSSATLKLVKKGSRDACTLAKGVGPRASSLVLTNGMAIGPKWDDTRNAWGQWDYIDLGVGEHSPASMQVHLNDRGFIVWNGKHGEVGMLNVFFFRDSFRDGSFVGFLSDGLRRVCVYMCVYVHTRTYMCVYNTYIHFCGFLADGFRRFHVEPDGGQPPRARQGRGQQGRQYYERIRQ